MNTKTGTYDNKHKFTGKELDTETSLTYFGARYYDSEIGRWMGVDPALLKVQFIRLLVPQDLNAYSYVKNNPLIYTDPDGQNSAALGFGGVILTGACVGSGACEVAAGVVIVGATVAFTVVVVQEAYDYFTEPAKNPPKTTTYTEPVGPFPPTPQTATPANPVPNVAPKGQGGSSGGSNGTGGGGIGPKIAPLIPATQKAEEKLEQVIGNGNWIGGTINNTQIIQRMSERIYNNLQTQLQKDGVGSIFKALKSAQQTLQEHEAKLPNMQYPSQVESTIQRVKIQIDTIQKFISDNGLTEK